MTVKIKVKDKLEDDTLDLSWCDLQEVPIKEIATIKKATHLDLSNNQLVSIPNTIVNLTHIMKLDLSKNLLTELPENIGDMKQLKHLDLYSNQLSRLPLSMGDLKNLKWLDLKGNPLTSAVAKVAGPCSNTTECQRCARNIVPYLLHLRKIADEEKRKQKEASAAAAAAAAIKKEKKKKKKNAAKDEKQNKGTDVQQSASHGNIVEQKSQANGRNKNKKSKPATGGFCSGLCGFFCSILKFLMFLAVVSVFALILLPRYNQPLSDKVIKYLEDQTKLPVKEYQKVGIIKFDESSVVLMALLNQTKILAAETFAKVAEEYRKCCGHWTQATSN